MATTIEVPASLSNLGPGFDVLGMAVGLWNRFEVAGEGAPGSAVVHDAPVPAEEHLVVTTARRAAEVFGVALPCGLVVRQQDGIPWSRGLGSSATARVAGYLSWAHLTGARPPVDDALSFLSAEEGHPDNVVAAMLGGVAASVGSGEGFRSLRFEPPTGLQVALCIPAVEVSTAAARAVMPTSYPLDDLVFNAKRLAFLLAGLRSGDPELLRLGQEDRVHQPYRKDLIGPVDASIAAANEAGAAAAFISGSGSTMAALVVDPSVDAQAVAEALAAPFRRDGVEAEARVVAPVSRGAWARFSG